MASKHFLSYGDSLLDESDVELLRGPNWVNDKLIDFAFEYLTNTLPAPSDTVLCCAEVVQIMKMCSDSNELAMILESLDLTKKQHIFLPVNDNSSVDKTGGSHWSLLVYEASSRTFLHFDSVSQFNYSTSVQVAASLAPLLEVHTKPTVQHADSPVQINGYDCGVYVIEIAKLLLHGLLKGQPITSSASSVTQISSSDITQARQDWATIITNLANEDSSAMG